MGYPETATGFLVNDQKKWTEFEKKEVCRLMPGYQLRALLTHFKFKLKQFGERDIDIAIDACGVCGSDVHTITG